MSKRKINWDLLEPKSWYLKKSDDEELGPMNESALRQLLTGGELEDDTVVRQGDSACFPIDDVRALFKAIDEDGWYIFDQGLEYGPFMPRKVRALFECGLFNAKSALIRQGSEGVLTTFETELANSRSRVRQKTSRGDATTSRFRESDKGDSSPASSNLTPEVPTSLEMEYHASISAEETGYTLEPEGRVTLSEEDSFITAKRESDGLIASYLSNLDDFDRALRAQRVDSGYDVYGLKAQQESSAAEQQASVAPAAEEISSKGGLARASWSAINPSDASTKFCPKCGIEHAITDDRCEVCFRAMEKKIRKKGPTENVQPAKAKESGHVSFRFEELNSNVAVFVAFAASGYFLSSWFTNAVLYRNYAGSSGVLNTWVPMVSGLALAAVAGLVLQFDPKLRDQNKSPVSYAVIFLVVAMINYSIKKLYYGEAEARVQEQQELWIKAMEGGDYRITPQEGGDYRLAPQEGGDYRIAPQAVQEE